MVTFSFNAQVVAGWFLVVAMYLASSGESEYRVSIQVNYLRLELSYKPVCQLIGRSDVCL